jgi:hypothetical protein
MIEIIESILIEDDPEGMPPFWACWLELTSGGESWMLPATAPGNLTKPELQAYFDEQAAYLWTLARAKKHSGEIEGHVDPRHVLRALLLVFLDEINILRENAGLTPRTVSQLRTALKRKLD